MGAPVHEQPRLKLCGELNYRRRAYARKEAIRLLARAGCLADVESHKARHLDVLSQLCATRGAANER